jgi:Putative peptidoglycan binding domain
MRQLPSRAGQTAARFSRPVRRFPGGPAQPRPVPPRRPPLWPPRPRPYPWPPRAVVRDPYSIVQEPDSVAPGATVMPGSEYIRWVQDCLNRTLGLQLLLTGVLGPETRSAIRAFQKQQYLSINGIVDPDTAAALRFACGGQPPQMDYTEEVLGEIKTLGPITATLRWLPNPKAPNLYTRSDAMAVEGGGVYIAVDTASNDLLKVGETGEFKGRFRETTYVDMERRIPNLKFYLAYIFGPSRGHCGAAGCNEIIERAIARTLRRAGATLPEDKRKAPPSEVTGPIKITHILPKPLLAKLHEAYGATVKHTKKKRLAGGPFSAISPRSTSLILDPKIHQVWELKIQEEPFNF